MSMTVQKGLISKIERFSLHDGPGIRTLVVTKGCPLKCLWCSSPHTQSSKPEILYIKSNCAGCGICVEVCENHTITLSKENAVIKADPSCCRHCGKCVSACVRHARELSGRYYTPEELLKEVEKDEAFYRRSGGGITVGGGEPTLQAGFTEKFLSLCRSRLFHTAMETCALAPWDKFSRLLGELDLVYIDLKHMDEKIHQEWTGASNLVILENIEKAARRHDVIVRIPVVPGFNDSRDNIFQSAKFVKILGKRIVRLELLPYHLFGIHKYEELARSYHLEYLKPPTDEHMTLLRDIARDAGIDVEIGG